MHLPQQPTVFHRIEIQDDGPVLVLEGSIDAGETEDVILLHLLEAVVVVEIQLILAIDLLYFCSAVVFRTIPAQNKDH